MRYWLVFPFVLLLAACQSMDDFLTEQQHETIACLKGALEDSFFAKNVALGPVNSVQLPSIEFQFQFKDRKSRESVELSYASDGLLQFTTTLPYPYAANVQNYLAAKCDVPAAEVVE
jgi:hypothetical protein